jgi:putative NADH-flavin reductase
MKLLIFGSTGGTGLELLKQALEHGHYVTAFARNPAKSDDIKHADLKVVRGDVLDLQAVETAISDQEAVLSAIGAGAGRTTLREDGTRIIVETMERVGVKRFISQSSLGVGDSRANLGSVTKYIVVPFFLRHAFADHEKQEEIIRKSSLDWIIVRPPHLNDGPRTGTYKHGFSPTNRGIEGKSSRADVADFMLKQLTDDTYFHKTPGISY